MELTAEQIKSLNDAVMPLIGDFKKETESRLKAIEEKGSDKALESQLKEIIRRCDQMEAEMKRPGSGLLGSSHKSIGQQFTEHEEFKKWVGRPWHKGGVAVPFTNVFADEYKTVITSSDVGSSTPGILTPQRTGEIIRPGVRRLRVRDLLRRFPTTKNAIEFVKENAYTNAASPQVEGSAKAESALTFTIEHAPVRTIAHWIPATRQILEDFRELQAYIEMRLLDGLKDKEDAELLTGDGTGQHLSGLITEATAYDTALNVAGDTQLDKVNHAILQVELEELYPDGIVLNPTDWRKMQLIKTEEGGANKGTYLLGGPRGDAQPMLWGLPVVATTAMTAGRFLVGAFDTAAAVWDREQARIDISTEHANFFTENKVAIRAEERIALTVFRPLAFVYGTF